MDCDQLPQHVIDYIVNRRILGLPELTAQEMETMRAGAPILRPSPTLKWQAAQEAEQKKQQREIVKAKRVKREDF